MYLHLFLTLVLDGSERLALTSSALALEEIGNNSYRIQDHMNVFEKRLHFFLLPEIIIIIIIIIHCKWVCNRWQWYYNTQKTQNNTHTQNNTQHTNLQTQ